METQELVFNGDVQRGANPPGEAKRVQEWLCLQGFRLGVDDDFGSITEEMTKRFQERAQTPVTGVVNFDTFERLVAPMRAALRVPVMNLNASLPDYYRAVALQHLYAKPREVGDNAGPWVRLYMRGLEGHKQKWCVGSLMTMLAQACEAKGVPCPFEWVDNANTIAHNAGALLVSGASDQAKLIQPAGIFVLKDPDKAGHYTHGGVFVGNKNHLDTIEGNFGGHSGEGMYSYARSFASCDLIPVG